MRLGLPAASRRWSRQARSSWRRRYSTAEPHQLGGAKAFDQTSVASDDDIKELARVELLAGG
jgi:hypothetical protein